VRYNKREVIKLEKEKKEAKTFIKPSKNNIYEIDVENKIIEKTIWAYQTVEEYKKSKLPRCVAIIFCQKKGLFSKTTILYKEKDAKKNKEIMALIKETEEELKQTIKEIKWK
jgi:septal ring factor EnvC (AmiA/AmiB activator)